MDHKITHMNGTQSDKQDLHRPRTLDTKPLARSLPMLYRDEQLDVEAALSPFWAWRITSH